jgi:hypothetical protein
MPACLWRVLLPTALGTLVAACGGKGGSGDGGSSTTGEPPTTPCSEEMPCPGEDVCVVGECYGGPLPTLEIVSPEDEAVVDWTNDGDTTDVTIRIEGTGLELTPLAMDPWTSRGNGQIAVLVDGVEFTVIEEGSLADGIEVDVPVPTDAGGHRVRAIARLTDGQDYDTEGAIANRFFWFDDGRVRLGFKSPWDSDRASDDQVEIAIEVAVINFNFVPATAELESGARGHAHILLNKTFPECSTDPVCIDDYIKVIAPDNGTHTSVAAPLLLPATSADSIDFTAHLVTTNHEPYCDEGPDVCDAVWETITLLRGEPAGADTGTGTGTGGGSTSSTTGETADCGGFVMTAEDSTTGS